MKRPIAVLLVLVLALALVDVRWGAAASAAPGYSPPPLRVGLVRSTASQAWVDLYSRGYGILEKQDRLYEYLTGRGWSVERISDADLESLAKLQQYDVIVCMWVFAMSPAAASTLRDYVAAGGGVATLFASPRVAPGVGGGERDDHWVYLLNHESWEWGPMSEVNQTLFVDDVGAMALEAKPAWGHPIVQGAAAILEARGLDAGDLTLVRDSTPGTWVELPAMLAGNKNTSQFMTMAQKSTPTGSGSYPGTHPGAVASEYLNGRMAYFYFSPVDFLPNMNIDGSATVTRPTGVRQGEIAGAMIESSIIWAASDGPSVGVLERDGRTYATVNIYQDGIYVSQFLHNEGNVSVNGTLTLRIFDPAGRLVYERPRYRIAIVPGAEFRYSHQYTPGRRLADGLYRVETSYVTSYPSYLRTYTQSAWVRRGGGTGFRTAYDAARTGGRYVFDPRVDRHAGTDRYATALAIADAAGGYPRPGGYVVIASGEGGADALVASSLAGAYDAPLVLTRQGSLPQHVENWLKNPARGFEKVLIVGGTSAVGEPVESKLKRIFGDEEGVVRRLAGGSRYDTAAHVARDVIGRLGAEYDGGVIVTNGRALVDAAAASAVAAGKGWPIVYVERDAVPDVAEQVLAEVSLGAQPPQAWIAGGTNVVTDAVRDTIVGIMPGVDIRRAAGGDRYETAVKLAELADGAGADWSVVGVASGVKLADALCLGSLIGRTRGVLVLTNGVALTVPTSAILTDHRASIDTVAIAGGTLVIEDSVTRAISRCLP